MFEENTQLGNVTQQQFKKKAVIFNKKMRPY